MQVVRAELGGVIILRVAGWLDATTSQDLQREVTETIGPNHTRIVFDFSELEYLSSAGLRVVLGAAKELRALHGALALYGANKVVTRVFEVSGFTRIIPVVGTEEEAVRKVAG
jgi:anti-anti-sigma factor